jgi:hypothetical protein
MRSLRERLNESKNDQIPKIGEIAVDWDGCEWEIKDMCRFSEKDKIKRLCKKYDHYGEFDPNDYDETPDTYIVAAQEYPFGDGTTIFIWGDDGLHY